MTGTETRVYTADELIHRPEISKAIETRDLSLINVNGKILDVFVNNKTKEITVEWEKK